LRAATAIGGDVAERSFVSITRQLLLGIKIEGNNVTVAVSFFHSSENATKNSYEEDGPARKSGEAVRPFCLREREADPKKQKKHVGE